MRAPEFPIFRNLSLEDKTLFDSLLKETQPEISELTFTNLFVWNSSEPVQISQLDNTMLVQRKRLRDGQAFLLPPLGTEPLPDVLSQLTKYEPDLRENGLQSFYGLTPSSGAATPKGRTEV